MSEGSSRFGRLLFPVSCSHGYSRGDDQAFGACPVRLAASSQVAPASRRRTPVSTLPCATSAPTALSAHGGASGCVSVRTLAGTDLAVQGSARGRRTGDRHRPVSRSGRSPALLARTAVPAPGRVQAPPSWFYGASVTGTAFVLWLLTTAVFFYVLYLVVRAGVREGVQQALRNDLLRDRRTSPGDGPPAPRGPRSFRQAREDL